MSVLDNYKARCVNCSNTRLVCQKHFYMYCADSKLEEHYLRDKKFKSKSYSNNSSPASSNTSTSSIQTQIVKYVPLTINIEDFDENFDENIVKESTPKN